MSKETNKADRWADLVLLWGVALGPLIVSATLSLAGAESGVAGADASASVVFQLLHELIGLGVLAYILRRQHRRLGDIGLSFQLADMPKSLIIALVGYVVFFVAFGLLPENAPLPGAAAEGPATLRGLASAQVILLMGLTVVNPIFEELICRAYAIGELQALTGSKGVAVLCSTGVQAYYHVYQGWRWAVASAALFLVLSLYFVSAKRAVPIILAHFYFDALGIYFLLRAYSSTSGAA